MDENRRLLSVAAFCGRHHAFTQASVRHLLFNRVRNGLQESSAVLRVGRKLVIDEGRFLAWIDARNHIAREDGR